MRCYWLNTVGENSLEQADMNTACLIAVCWSFIGQSQTIKPKQSQVDTCVEIGESALIMNVDQSLALAVGWEESRFIKSALSNKGAAGPMQIIPRYWCPNKTAKGCDLLIEGIKAIKSLTGKYGTKEGLCRYSSGRSCKHIKRARWYRSRVLGHRRSLDAQFFKKCGGC